MLKNRVKNKLLFGISDLHKRIALSIAMSRLALPMITATLVGILTGYIIVFFIECIGRSEKLFMQDLTGTLSALGPYAIVLVPAVGGLVIGALVNFLAPDAGGNGVPAVMKAVALRGGKIRLLTVLVKGVASVVAIGSGASTGREGPAVQIGAGIGSLLARLFRLSEARVKNLVACGAAAGISAVFNAPITGVMFALEIILKDFGARALSTVVVSSVSAGIISRIYLGESPAFSIPLYRLRSPMEIFLYLGLGILAALAALLFIFIYDRTEKQWTQWRFPVWLKPAIGGLVVGVMGLYFPEVLGMGFHTIEKTLHGNFTVTFLLALLVFKIFATSISLGSGSSGGTFAPVLFTGTVLGGAYGKLCYGHFPFPMAPPGAYALVGMASVFAGAFHAPVTAILLIFEMTGDYSMILPIMMAAVVSVTIAQIACSESIDTVKLKREGIDPASMEEVKVLGALQVRDAMTREYETVSREISAKELIDFMAREKDKSFFVLGSQGELTGIIKRKEVQEVLLEKDLTAIIADDIAVPVADYCFPDEALSEAAGVMMAHHLTQLPVVNPSDPRKIVGVLKSEDIFRAYAQETVKREELLSRIEQEGVQAGGTIQIRFLISSKSLLAGKFIRELDLPDGVVLTSIQRKKATLIPEGHTVLAARDRVWAVIHPEADGPFKEWLKRNKLDRSFVLE
ncbi:MAG: hypothetical protein A2Z83_02730 [Omnitrophica bacterium GWA2_52_8]|nr:MAG: hypothetical protein A2Z83_02730 [Omnitrophica bacterium GWA2_52_8]